MAKKENRVLCPERNLDEINHMIEKHVPKTGEAKEMLEFLSKQLNVKHLLAVEADHCIESYACLIDSPDFGRILYSGDTRPCQTILNYAQRVKLLIHEATFEDSLQEDAHWKKHTTIGEAIEVAEKCQPWRLVLTHFSPRYQKIAEISERNMTTKTMVAFDHMRVKLSYFEWAYTMLDVYKKFFTNDDEVNTYGSSSKKNQEESK